MAAARSSASLSPPARYASSAASKSVAPARERSSSAVARADRIMRHLYDLYPCFLASANHVSCALPPGKATTRSDLPSSRMRWLRIGPALRPRPAQSAWNTSEGTPVVLAHHSAMASAPPAMTNAMLRCWRSLFSACLNSGGWRTRDRRRRECAWTLLAHRLLVRPIARTWPIV